MEAERRQDPAYFAMHVVSQVDLRHDAVAPPHSLLVVPLQERVVQACEKSVKDSRTVSLALGAVGGAPWSSPGQLGHFRRDPSPRLPAAFRAGPERARCLRRWCSGPCQGVQPWSKYSCDDRYSAVEGGHLCGRRQRILATRLLQSAMVQTSVFPLQEDGRERRLYRHHGHAGQPRAGQLRAARRPRSVRIRRPLGGSL